VADAYAKCTTTMPFQISALSPMLKTRNLPQTIAFYAPTLGFTIANQNER